MWSGDGSLVCFRETVSVPGVCFARATTQPGGEMGGGCGRAGDIGFIIQTSSESPIRTAEYTVERNDEISICRAIDRSMCGANRHAINEARMAYVTYA